MPELPEVETVRRGLRPLEGATLERVIVRKCQLRRRVSVAALHNLAGGVVAPLVRRAKYLLIPMVNGGGKIIHLGMSGRLFMANPGDALDQHDHLSWWLKQRGATIELRFPDPRRFGSVTVLQQGDLREHPLLANLGPEPLGNEFTADYAFTRSKRSRRPIKNALMDARFVVGIGNIYASEALWRAQINPKTAVCRISRRRWGKLVWAVQDVLDRAVSDGGTTLNDFFGASGDPGYFQTRLRAYGQRGEPCHRCGSMIRRISQAGRATYYCVSCQH